MENRPMGRTRSSQTCQHCGMTGLYWKRNAAGTPYLHNPDETQHTGFAGNCPKRRNAAVQPEQNPAQPEYVPAARYPVPPAVPATPAFPVPVTPAVPAYVPETSQTEQSAGKAIFDIVQPHVSKLISEELENIRPREVVITHDVILRDADGNEKAKIEGAHPMLALVIKRALQKKFHILLSGPAGSGKTYAADMVSQILGLEYYPISVGPQTSKSDLMGFLSGKDGEYIPSVVYTAYRNGGVLLLDELDAGNPGVLTTLNGVLSGSRVRFPNGELVSKHPDFICIAAANTFGRGATQRYSGRNRLDGATLSRFVKMFWDYSEELERGYAATQPEWLAFVTSIRHAADTLRMD